MFSGLGKLGHGTSSRSSNRTSSTMAEAGLKISATALALTLEVICAANAKKLKKKKKKKIRLCKHELARMVRMFPLSPSPLQ